jgi:predicted Zn-dependent protease
VQIKDKSTDRIDGIVATIIALTLAMTAPVREGRASMTAATHQFLAAAVFGVPVLKPSSIAKPESSPDRLQHAAKSQKPHATHTTGEYAKMTAENIKR